ncbi:MAG: hypothetical protein Q8L99_11120, partial [Polycyclovorans sp.]|nr:hypothetical protein [Polycyclovorans sp.]
RTFAYIAMVCTSSSCRAKTPQASEEHPGQFSVSKTSKSWSIFNARQQTSAENRGTAHGDGAAPAKIRNLPQNVRKLKRDHSDLSAQSADSADPPDENAQSAGLIEVEL